MSFDALPPAPTSAIEKMFKSVQKAHEKANEDIARYVLEWMGANVDRKVVQVCIHMPSPHDVREIDPLHYTIQIYDGCTIKSVKRKKKKGMYV